MFRFRLSTALGALAAAAVAAVIAAKGAEAWLRPAENREFADELWSTGYVVRQCDVGSGPGAHREHLRLGSPLGLFPPRATRALVTRRLEALDRGTPIPPREHAHHLRHSEVVRRLEAGEPVHEATSADGRHLRRLGTCVSTGCRVSWPGRQPVVVDAADVFTVDWSLDDTTVLVGAWRDGRLDRVYVLRPGLILQDDRVRAEAR